VQLVKFAGIEKNCLLVHVMAVVVQSQPLRGFTLLSGVRQATPCAVSRCTAAKSSRVSAATPVYTNIPGIGFLSGPLP